jgi:threonine dehydrogenase-like Zn-dependent dehydrogenase
VGSYQVAKPANIFLYRRNSAAKSTGAEAGCDPGTRGPHPTGSSLSRSGIMLDPMPLGGRGMTLGSISVGSRADFEAMNRAIALHKLRPVIARMFPFEEARDAYRYFESRAHIGKVVISHG